MRTYEHIRRFSRRIRQSYGLPIEQLLVVIRAKDRFTVRTRAAALRNLVGEAPLAVTRGRPYAERRRLVRRYYGV